MTSYVWRKFQRVTTEMTELHRRWYFPNAVCKPHRNDSSRKHWCRACSKLDTGYL